MRILIFHPCLLPPADYGGVERVVLWLAKGLVERGHETWIAAFPGSRLPAGVRLLEVGPTAPSAEVLLKALPAGTDLVHFMAPPEPGVMEKLPCSSLLTVHGNGKPGEIFPLNTVFLSRDHARRHGAVEFVYNGIDPAELVYAPASKNDSYLFLSKTSWSVKNLAGAMSLCAGAGVGLTIAGGNRPWLRRAEAWLRPGFHWEGPVAGERKARVLSEAKALLFPVLWPEPFGLVVVESLMSGTPVLASRLGSLPELVTPDVGALFDLSGGISDPEWCEFLVRERLPWDPEACRARALEHFHYCRMAENYEKLYVRIASGERLHEKPPIAGAGRHVFQ